MKNKFITTAISYANGPPHIGHAFEFIIADVLNRFYKLNNFSTFFLTGMDEHGQKIQKTAEQNGLTPIQLCDQTAELFKQLDANLNVSYDRFIRTTESDHKKTVHDVFNRCLDNGDIYLDEYVGWYNPREENFVTEFEASKTNYKDPSTNVDYIKMKEPSYFFRLSKYYDKIKEFIRKNPDFIIGAGKTNEVLSRLDQQPLNDISISRTTISWGIPLIFPETEKNNCVENNSVVNNDNNDIENDNNDEKNNNEKNDKHVFYVWFDALVNYISGAPNLCVWPADIHIIGKDIVWFHSVIWLGMLFSANLPLPRQLCVHGFINDKNGKKMSKSIGNVVSPDDLISKYPSCSIRYYLLKENVLDDVNFSEDALIRCNDTELLANLGNLVHRTFSMFHKYGQSIIPIENAKIMFDIKKTVDDTSLFMANVHIHLYVEKIFNMLMELNTFVNDTKIWEIGNPKLNDQRTASDRSEIIRTLLESLFIMGHFLLPIMPETATKIVCDFFGKSFIPFSQLNWNNLTPLTVLDKKDTILFRTLDTSAYDVRKQKMITKKQHKN